MIPGFTRDYGVRRLVHFEVFDTMEDAILRERRLKEWRRAWKIELIERQNERWDDLPPRTAVDGSRRPPG